MKLEPNVVLRVGPRGERVLRLLDFDNKPDEFLLYADGRIERGPWSAKVGSLRLRPLPVACGLVEFTEQQAARIYALVSRGGYKIPDSHMGARGRDGWCVPEAFSAGSKSLMLRRATVR